MPSQGLVFIAKNSFSAVSSVSFDNVFTSTYLHYLLVPNVTASDAVGIHARLRTGGSDASGSDYYRQYIGGQGSSVTPARDSTTFINTLFGYAAGHGTVIVTLFNPHASVLTTSLSSFLQDVTSPDYFIRANVYNATTSFDGFTAYVAVGTITGSISVFGYVTS